ncbi:MAG TPA: DUF2917 domain-containing protein [Ramlibacter sp.]
MNKEDSLQFVQERLRYNHSALGRELRIRDAPRVRRRFAVQMHKGEHRTFERVDDSVLVCCASGSLWITHDGDPKDVILVGGEHYWAEREDAMHLFALQDCVVEVQFDDDVIEH